MNRIIAIDPEAVHRYIPKIARDWPEEDRPIFLIKTLKARDAASLQDGQTDAVLDRSSDNNDTTMRFNTGSTVLKALRKGLKGWENFKTSDGEKAPWRDNNGIPRDDNFDYIPVKIRSELAEAITEGTFLTEQEEKNSE